MDTDKMANAQLTKPPGASDTDRLERLIAEIRKMVADAAQKNCTGKCHCELQFRNGGFERAVLSISRVIQ